MTPDELNAIEARHRNGTQGEWTAQYHAADLTWWVVGSGRRVCVCDDGRCENSADAERIALSRADITTLVAEVRRLRAEIGRAVDTLDVCIPGAAHDPAWNYTLVRNMLASAIKD